MNTRLFLVFAFCLSVVPLSASADDPAQANKLLVEAARLMEEAAAKSGMDRVASLQAVLNRLHRIVEDHPSSNAAVQLVTGQKIGFLELWRTEVNLVQALLAAGDVEGALSTAKRVSRLTKEAEGEGHRDIALALVAEAQSKSGDHQSAKETANLIERDFYRDIVLRGLSMSR